MGKLLYWQKRERGNGRIERWSSAKRGVDLGGVEFDTYHLRPDEVAGNVGGYGGNMLLLAVRLFFSVVLLFFFSQFLHL